MRIERYSFGSICIDGHTYKNDLIIFPDRIQEEWWRKDGHKLQVGDLSDILVEPPKVLVLGRGDYGRMQIDPHVHKELDKLHIELVAVPTGEACRKFNELSEQGKHVVAALHLTC